MMPRLADNPAGRARAFTLVELLVVIILITIVTAAAAPTLRMLSDFSRGDAGVTVVSSAVNAARVFTHRSERPNLDAVGIPFEDADLTDRGTAVIVTQGGEFRLTEHHQLALHQSGDPLSDKTLSPPLRVGFRDVSGTDYLTLPRRTGIVGVTRDGAGSSGVRFVPPPFAIRFNANGQMVCEEEYVYYDFDGDNRYDDNEPDDDYNPTDDDPRSGGSPSVNADGRTDYIYEKMPVVSAVVLFDLATFVTSDEITWDDLGSSNSTTRDEVREWFQDYGTPVYFSPLTGVALRGMSQ